MVRVLTKKPPTPKGRNETPLRGWGFGLNVNNNFYFCALWFVVDLPRDMIFFV